MNDRIKALGRQATDLALEEYRTRQKTEFVGDVIYSDIYDQKFAELIVKECIEQGKQIQSQTIIGGSEDYIAGREMGIEVFTNQIKQHFGIE